MTKVDWKSGLVLGICGIVAAAVYPLASDAKDKWMVAHLSNEIQRLSSKNPPMTQFGEQSCPKCHWKGFVNHVWFRPAGDDGPLCKWSRIVPEDNGHPDETHMDWDCPICGFQGWAWPMDVKEAQ